MTADSPRPCSHHHFLAACLLSSGYLLSESSLPLSGRTLTSRAPAGQSQRVCWRAVLTSCRHSSWRCSTSLCWLARCWLCLRQPASHHCKRSPAWTWQMCVHTDRFLICLWSAASAIWTTWAWPICYPNCSRLTELIIPQRLQSCRFWVTCCGLWMPVILPCWPFLTGQRHSTPLILPHYCNIWRHHTILMAVYWADSCHILMAAPSLSAVPRQHCIWRAVCAKCHQDHSLDWSCFYSARIF